MGIEAVIFDLYGTLVDIYTDEEGLSAYQTLSQFLSYYEIFLEPGELARQYRDRAGAKLLEHPGPYGEIDVYQVFEEILAAGWGRQPERQMVIWLARLFRSLTRRWFALFPDTLPALEYLYPRYELGMVSDAQWVYSEPEIRMLGLNRFFDPIVLSSRYFMRKPDPQIYAHALKALRLTPAQALYVGNDPERDIPGPQALGMPVVIIDRAGAFPFLHVPTLTDLRQLHLYLEEHGG